MKSPIDSPFEAAETAAAMLRDRLGDDLNVAVVLGSGWAAAADRIGKVRGELPLTDLPGSPGLTVAGHSGLVRAVEVGSKTILVIGGRNHLYEGHDANVVAHNVRSAILAGCSTVILTNACGSLQEDFRPGTPVMIKDQINLTGTTPMIGANPPAHYPGRFCDVTEIYSQRLRDAARLFDQSLGEGVYCGMFGGAYETPAEIEMIRTMGGELVGMSTVLEAIAAKHLEAEIAGVSLVTNLAAGMAGKLSHAEVLEVAQQATDRVVALIAALVDAAH